MSLRSGSRLSRSERPLLSEFAVVVATLAVLVGWLTVAREFLVPALGFAPGGPGFEVVDSLLVAGAITGGLVLAGVVTVAVAYVAARDVNVGVSLPPVERAPTVAAAVLAPLALVAATKLVGVLTGTAYSTLLLRSYGAAATVEHALSMTLLTLFLGVPTLLVVCQVLVQGSLRRVVGGDAAVALTTVLAGFLLVDASGGLDTTPEPGRLVGAGLFAVAVAVALYGTDRFESDAVRALSVAPLGLLAGVTVITGVAAVWTVPAAQVVFVCVKLAVLAVAAYGYDRTRSLLVPALTYACFLASSEAVVFLLEAGVQNW